MWHTAGTENILRYVSGLSYLDVLSGFEAKGRLLVFCETFNDGDLSVLRLAAQSI